MSRRLPAIKPSQLIRALERAGFFVHHVSGSHYVMRHSREVALRVVVPYHNKDLRQGTLHSILRDAKISPDQLRELL
jgi:predicted RNA binding protein YcfA (HicA-like mRNA interferase family)